jgi:cytochrome b involved in lipid metabolism
MGSKTFSRAEVAKHNTIEDLWCIIDHTVYDLSDFVDAHPGGEVVLRQVAGTDATAGEYPKYPIDLLL